MSDSTMDMSDYPLDQHGNHIGDETPLILRSPRFYTWYNEEVYSVENDFLVDTQNFYENESTEFIGDDIDSNMGIENDESNGIEYKEVVRSQKDGLG